MQPSLTSVPAARDEHLILGRSLQGPKAPWPLVNFSEVTEVTDCNGGPGKRSQAVSFLSEGKDTSQSHSRKRLKPDDQRDDDSGDEDQKKAPLKRDAGFDMDPTQPKLFACPYYKLDPIKYLNCFKRFHLKRVKDVKQHLHRKHSVTELYCPTCWRTFEGRPERDDHIIKRSCSPRDQPTADPDVMTPEQQRLIAKRTDSGLDEPKQWFGIWKILFPQKDEPKSPYLGTELQEVIGTVRQYWRAHCHSIISNARQRSSGSESSTIEEFETMSAAERGIHHFSAEVLTDTMEILLDRFNADTRERGKECSRSPPLQEAAPLHSSPSKIETENENCIVLSQGLRNNVEFHGPDSYESVPIEEEIKDLIPVAETDSAVPLDVNWPDNIDFDFGDFLDSSFHPMSS